MVYPALLPLMCTPRLPVVDWTDAPAGRLKWTRPCGRKTKFGFCACTHHISAGLYLGIGDIYKWGSHCLCTENIPCENGLYMTGPFLMILLTICWSFSRYHQSYLSALLLGFSTVYSSRLKKKYLTLTTLVGSPAWDLTLMRSHADYLQNVNHYH